MVVRVAGDGCGMPLSVVSVLSCIILVMIAFVCRLCLVLYHTGDDSICLLLLLLWVGCWW